MQTKPRQRIPMAERMTDCSEPLQPQDAFLTARHAGVRGHGRGGDRCGRGDSVHRELYGARNESFANVIYRRSPRCQFFKCCTKKPRLHLKLIGPESNRRAAVAQTAQELQTSQGARADPCPPPKEPTVKHQNWTTEPWKKVAWSDESRGWPGRAHLRALKLKRAAQDGMSCGTGGAGMHSGRGLVGFGVGTISCRWERRAESCAHGGEIHIGAAMCSSSHESLFLFIYRPPRSHRSDSCHHGNRSDTTATVCSPHAGRHTPLEEFRNSGYGKTPSHVVSLWMSLPEMMTTCSTSPADRVGTVVCKDYLVISWIRSHNKQLHHASVHSSEGPRKAWRASSDSRKSKCSHANHEARSPTVTAKNIEHLWVMADRRRRRRLGIHSTSARSADHNTQYRPDDSVGRTFRKREGVDLGFEPPVLGAVA
ncbi:hypothetical protein DPX16_3065 [Anabarilius grahami]|uniref:Uncharacterized protein n=1 Tax=Anabarilius grahami TaxID=495550 RepID=A0A3N0XIU9_ANAGA|nr:hypothetical protein DPX16_3065 [Anabarilius grahami]